jgi:23S rRNA pseudouridine1911/1915/1917 synthase
MIYLDNHLLIMNKPAGLATQPSKDNEKNLQDNAKFFLKKKYKKTGAVFLEPIHRLDKPVSGLVVFARTSKALSRLQEAMRSHQIERIYQALVEKEAPGGILEHYLVHDEYKARVVPSTHPEGKKAILHYTYLGPVKKGHLLEIRLETGRYHQIRAQLADSHLPVIGDEKYGSKIPFKKGEIALHHSAVSFCHPVTKEQSTFTAPRPTSWHC